MIQELAESMMRKRAFSDTCDSGASAERGAYDGLLPLVRKPARYVGGEVNLVRKDPGDVKLRMALAFPDVYEVGMSHLGLKILYSIVNSKRHLAAERVFAVWPDMEELMRKNRRPLVSLESGTPLHCFDVIGFSLQYELCATTVLQMLDLGGVPLRAKDRGPGDPLVIAGGPVAFNPVPMAPFFDAFAMGDGEELIIELAESIVAWKEEDRSRDELLAGWKRLKGVFVPSLYSAGESVSRRIVADLDTAAFPSNLVVPFCETVHDRVGVEIARGCTRGCRFCQAGMLYRPVREREPTTVLDLAEKSLEATGWDEVALLSLSSGDYSCIGDLVRAMAENYGRDKVALSLPSLRTETLDRDVAGQIRKVRKTGFTLAPEAGTDRLRRIINKGNTEEDLRRAVSTAFEHGWKAVKLYFMIGLPGETDEDLDGIVGLIRNASKWARGGQIRVSVSTFVPKSHTPFQWVPQISTEETRRRQSYIRRYFRSGRVRIKFHHVRTSFLEGVIARGDDRLSEVVELAYQKGARLDGWDELLKFDVWIEALDELGIDPKEYLRPRTLSEALPWDFIDTGVTREFLIREWERALAGESTGDCRTGDCQECGACDFEEIYPRTAGALVGDFGANREGGDDPPTGQVRRFRLHYGKKGLMRFMGHRDLIRVFHRAFRRSGFRLDYSAGFHPHPKLRFSPPLSVGVESMAEYLEFDLVDYHGHGEGMMDEFRGRLPEGIEPFSLKEIQLNNPPISAKIQHFTYEIGSFGLLSPEELVLRLEEFEASPAFEVTSERKGKTRRRDLKELVRSIEWSGSSLIISLRAGPRGSVNPLDATAAILGISKEEVRSMRVVKTSAGFEARSGEDEGTTYE